MCSLKVIHQVTGQVFADHVSVTTSFYQRAKGLLGRSMMKEGEGLYIPHCSSIHTFFMRFPIDVLFLDKDHNVTKVCTGLMPFRIALGPWSTRGVLELPHGTLKDKLCQRGDTICFIQWEEGLKEYV